MEMTETSGQANGRARTLPSAGAGIWDGSSEFRPLEQDPSTPSGSM